MTDEWISPASIDAVAQDEIHVWRLNLDNAQFLAEAADSLSEEEQTRAERRLPGKVRNEFVYGRIALRRLLAVNLGLPPGAVIIRYEPNGKPFLGHISDLSFNVSHSHGALLIALRRSGNVGVDVEFIDPSVNISELAPSVFSEGEMDVLRSATRPSARQAVFYRTWVRKEALIKADGRGLSIPLTSLHVPGEAALNHPIQLLDKFYFLKDIPLEQGYRGAIAYESHDCRISLRNFPVPA